jgi:hypothetical protein
MKSVELNSADSLLVFDTGEEVVSALQKLTHDQKIEGGTFSALGAFQRAVIAYWNWDTKEYEKIEIDEQVEVLSLLGNVARGEKGEPKVHAHVTLGRRSGDAVGGHLLKGHVRPTLEMVLTRASRRLSRRHDPETRLQLLDLH